jgi:hypothetical protein
MTVSVLSNTAEVDIQTDPILIPFPLPPLEKTLGCKKQLESVSIQTEYVWISHEFPTRNSEVAGCHRESPKAEKNSKNRSPRKQVTEKIQGDHELVAESRPTISASKVQQDTVESEPAITPKKVQRKGKVIQEQPLTPATSAGPDTPIAAEATPLRKKALLKPVFSDSSDEEHSLIQTPSKTRKVRLVSVKPSITATPVDRPVPAVAKAQTQQNESSDSEQEPQSSSSESDADVPSVSLIASKKRKEDVQSKMVKQVTPETKAPEANITSRLGPLVQIEDVAENHIETLRKRILELIPEPLRSGAIKEAVFDEKNKRILFQLRIAPKIVNFMSANGGIVSLDEKNERKLVVLSDASKKKASSLFKEESPIKKRRQV